MIEETCIFSKKHSFLDIESKEVLDTLNKYKDVAKSIQPNDSGSVLALSMPVIAIGKVLSFSKTVFLRMLEKLPFFIFPQRNLDIQVQHQYIESHKNDSAYLSYVFAFCMISTIFILYLSYRLLFYLIALNNIKQAPSVARTKAVHAAMKSYFTTNILMICFLKNLVIALYTFNSYHRLFSSLVNQIPINLYGFIVIEFFLVVFPLLLSFFLNLSSHYPRFSICNNFIFSIILSLSFPLIFFYCFRSIDLACYLPLITFSLSIWNFCIVEAFSTNK